MLADITYEVRTLQSICKTGGILLRVLIDVRSGCIMFEISAASKSVQVLMCLYFFFSKELAQFSHCVQRSVPRGLTSLLKWRAPGDKYLTKTVQVRPSQHSSLSHMKEGRKVGERIMTASHYSFLDGSPLCFSIMVSH